MARVTKIEQGIIDAGALRIAEFTTHGGESANYRVEMEDILGEDSSHRELRGMIADRLAKKLEPYEPEVIIPIPEGANYLGAMIARRLGVRVVYLAWRDKAAHPRQLQYHDQHNRIVVNRAIRVALIDDVYTSGLSLEEVVEFTELDGKQVVGGIAFDRSAPKVRKASPYPIESVVSRHLPLRV